MPIARAHVCPLACTTRHQNESCLHTTLYTSGGTSYQSAAAPCAISAHPGEHAVLCAGVHMQRCVAGRMGNCADLHAPLRTFYRFVINLGLPPLSHRFVINIGPPPPLRFNTATQCVSFTGICVVFTTFLILF